MLRCFDFIIVTIFVALLAIGIPVLWIFVDAHIVAKILWTLLALFSVCLWCQSFVRYRNGRKRNEKPTEFDNKDAFFCGGVYFVSSLAAYVLLGYFLDGDIEPSWEMFASIYTYIGICLPVVLWRLSRKAKNEDSNK